MTLRRIHAVLLCAPLLLATACGEKDPPDDTGPHAVDADEDGYDADEDCDDGDPTVFPGATEICDGADNDCDGEIDDGAGDAWYPDADEDGYGDATGAVLACEQPSGFVADDADCDDSDGEVHPGAPERCNGVDDDCDGDVDDDPATTWYSDVDGDGYGNPGFAINSCDPGSGWVENDEDCDDTDAAIHPDAEEVCNDQDDNCNGGIDEALDETWYADADGDGYGDEATTHRACMQEEGWVADHSDCDDTDAAIHPDAAEYCDGLDNDCDGDVDDDDDDVADQATWYLDGDGDGYGLDSAPLAACEQPSGHAALGGDCDDADTAFNPGAAETDCTDPNDYNCDGSVGYADADSDGFAACEECDDGDAAIFPGADELCNGADDDCDGTTDEDDAIDAPTWYADADVDGYGDAATTAVACAAPSGFVADASDCDDADATLNPGAAEVCDTLDNDCDGDVDDADADVTGQATWYADADADGYGDSASALDACFQPTGFVSDDTDCDDTADTVNPAATERCDGVDDDCDGTVDEDDAADALTWYADMDLDGYGDATISATACAQPSGFVADDTDCDDHDDDINPAATELCDGVDDDCDGTVDEDDAADALTWYADADGDGYGDAATTAVACTVPSGHVADGTDCDDTNAAINPGATEVCDGADDDCDGLVDDDDPSVTGASTWYADFDGDGYGAVGYPRDACVVPSGYVADATDCDDLHAAAHPGADEYCDGLDDDCDGTVDEDDALDAATWYLDVDGDGYGDAASTDLACYQPAGFVGDDTDCDDADPAVNPGAIETCNGTDDDCDGAVDEDEAADALTWYADLDSDAYGDAASPDTACSQPTGFVADDTDCDDGDAAINPAATEICDHQDNDCDGDVDDDDAGVAGQSTWYADADADGYGEAATSAVSCFVPTGYVAGDTDCDDAAAAINPAATEVCDTVDNDCDGDVDDDDAGVVGQTTWYADADADGYGDAASTSTNCYVPTGYVAGDTDCDDTDAAEHPGAAEYCDGDDNDCDGSVDELGAVDGDTVYVDADGDTWGDPATVTTACTLPSGYVEVERDCDDSDPTIYPYAGDLYGDGEDSDCDGYDSEADWYDSESYFTLIPDASYLWADAQAACQGIGYDDLASVQDRSEMGSLLDLATDSGLGASHDFYIGYNDLAVEGTFVWSDGMSGTWTNWDSGEPNDLWGEDCSEFIGTTGNWNDLQCGSTYLFFTCELRLSDVSISDDDGDGYAEADGDCDDVDATTYPGAVELCDGIDNDCDDDIDEGGSTWYRDYDGDGYGDASTSTTACSMPTGYVADDTDCDDTDASVHPGATEVGDGVDNDCDGMIDEGTLSVDGTTYTLSAGTYTYDTVEVINGGTLYIDDQVVIECVDFTVDSSSYVDGDAAGYAGGTTSSRTGSGTGGGGSSSSAGAGGGGYGGAGGRGGYDSSDSPGSGGSSYGASSGMSIYPGSGGGATDSSAGGDGGAALEVYAETISIAGDVTVVGATGGGPSGRCGGGGSGGGILLVADEVTVSGSLDASGGDGGSGTSSANDGGGGGGGGRIKVFYSSNLSFTGSYDVSGGSGGVYGTASYGSAGSTGSYYESTY
ncbi:MAG: MopE-related protein [Pseudomonadota bacterium]